MAEGVPVFTKPKLSAAGKTVASGPPAPPGTSGTGSERVVQVPLTGPGTSQKLSRSMFQSVSMPSLRPTATATTAATATGRGDVVDRKAAVQVGGNEVLNLSA